MREWQHLRVGEESHWGPEGAETSLLPENLGKTHGGNLPGTLALPLLVDFSERSTFATGNTGDILSVDNRA